VLPFRVQSWKDAYNADVDFFQLTIQQNLRGRYKMQRQVEFSFLGYPFEEGAVRWTVDSALEALYLIRMNCDLLTAITSGNWQTNRLPSQAEYLVEIRLEFI
jgi:hypothetical protein